jgi:hypothetical protein
MLSMSGTSCSAPVDFAPLLSHDLAHQVIGRPSEQLSDRKPPLGFLDP